MRKTSWMLILWNCNLSSGYVNSWNEVKAMRREEYACPNGCSLPPRKKQLREYSNGIYGFDFYDFTFCPCCGSLMPYSLKKLKGFFEVYNIHAALSDAVQLIYKSEFESAAREAFVAQKEVRPGFAWIRSGDKSTFFWNRQANRRNKEGSPYCNQWSEKRIPAQWTGRHQVYAYGLLSRAS